MYFRIINLTFYKQKTEGDNIQLQYQNIKWNNVTSYKRKNKMNSSKCFITLLPNQLLESLVTS